MMPFALPSLFLTLLSFVFWILTVQIGPNIVLNTYAQAARRFLDLASPYQAYAVNLDQFKYSPLFAWGFGGLMTFTQEFGVEHWRSTLQVWTLVNSFLFWLGVCRWIDFRKSRPSWFWIFFSACFLSLDLCLWYAQSNALIVGLMLIGLAEFKEGRQGWAGFFLALATNLKVFPFFLALLLFKQGNRRYFSVFALTLITSLFVPALHVGWQPNLTFLKEWVEILGSDMQGRGILDLQTVLGQGRWLSFLILGITSIGFWGRFSDRELPWISAALSAILLTNPRTELPSFVIAGVALLFLVETILERFKKWAWVIALPLFAVAYYLAFQESRFTAAKLVHGEMKTWGTLFIWVLGVILVTKQSTSVREYFLALFGEHKEPIDSN